MTCPMRGGGCIPAIGGGLMPGCIIIWADTGGLTPLSWAALSAADGWPGWGWARGVWGWGEVGDCCAAVPPMHPPSLQLAMSTIKHHHHQDMEHLKMNQLIIIQC